VAPAGSTVYVSDRVSVRTEGTQRVISVHGVVFAHYELADRVAEAYAMIMLCESGSRGGQLRPLLLYRPKP
jgi:hypothetical protein